MFGTINWQTDKYRFELSERNIHEQIHLTNNIDQNIKDIAEAIM